MMKKAQLLGISVLLVLGLHAQKMGNGFADVNQRIVNVNEVNTAAAAARFHNQVNAFSDMVPIGINQFRESYGTSFTPIYFEVYPNPASNWLGCDFPAKSNIQFVRILDVAGQIVASFHRWDRLFYVGNLQSGLYQIQVVQFDNYAHSTAFYKR
jgi:hypothetical protein